MQLVLSASRHLHIAVDDTNGKRMADDASVSRVTEAEAGFNGDLLWAAVDSVDNAGGSTFLSCRGWMCAGPQSAMSDLPTADYVGSGTAISQRRMFHVEQRMQDHT
jgi:hypothetical protein